MPAFAGMTGKAHPVSIQLIGIILIFGGSGRLAINSNLQN
jgi:hypothetical protein